MGHSGDILQPRLNGCEGTPGKEPVRIIYFYVSCPKSACFFSPVIVESVEGACLHYSWLLEISAGAGSSSLSVFL